MSTAKETLQKQRRNAKGRVTRQINRLEGLVEESSDDIEEMLAGLQILDDCYKKVEEVHEDLNLLITDDDEEAAADVWISDIFSRVSDTRKKVRCHARRQREESKATPKQTVDKRGKAESGMTSDKTITDADDDSTEVVAKTTIEETPVDVDADSKSYVPRKHAPIVRYKLELPRFTGALREYRKFKNTFKTLVDSDGTEANTKLHVLRGRLAKVPAQLIANIEDYKEAWDKLDTTFGRTDQLTDVCYQELHEIKPMRRGDAAGFLHFAATVQDVIIQLRNAGCDADLQSTGLLKTITQKMTDEDRERWGRDTREGRNANTVIGLNDWLEKESIVKSQAYSLEPSTSKPRHSAAVNAVQDDRDSVRKKRPCPCCKGSHYLGECSAFEEKTVDERWQVVKEGRCCFSCLKGGHPVKDCRMKKECSKEQCVKKHHPLLHKDVVVATATRSAKSNCVLPVVRVVVMSANGRQKEGNLLIDSGAQLTLIRSSFARSLGLQGPASHVNLSVVGGQSTQQKTRRLSLKIAPIDDKDQTFDIDAVELETVCASVGPLDEETTKRHHHLRDIDFSHRAGPIDILLGVDHPQLHIGEVRTGNEGSPVAVKSPLGWVMFGPADEEKTAASSAVLTVSCSPGDLVTSQAVDLTSFWETDTLGVTAQPCSCKATMGSQEDRKAAAMLKTSCQKSGERYEIALPWKRDPRTLPDNFNLALKRLEATERKLRKNPDLAADYDKKIMEYEQLGFARKLSEEEAKSQDGPRYYIAHHAVIRTDKTSTPIRIVFDASAKFEGNSLNDYLYKGPDLLNSLFGVITRFRENSIAICTDISKMFNQIKLPPRDQQVHRFLWRNMKLDTQPDTYMMTRVSFGDKPAPAMAQTVLWQTAEDNQDEFPVAAKTIKENTYVDDVCESVATEEEAEELTNGITEVLKRGGFSLKKWVSNSSTLTVIQQSSSQDVKEIDGQREKILGAVWDAAADSITFKVKQMEAEVFTKRTILSKIAQIFDPIGFAAAFLIRAKIGMQELWIKGLSWDEAVDSETENKWKTLFQEMGALEKVNFPRCLTPENSLPNPTLHIFCDASDKAFAACAYLRWEMSDGKDAELRFVAAKTRVAPIKKLTIPRLELQGAVLGTRLAKTILNETRIKVRQTTYWSDSTVVLSWIRSSSMNYKPFVAVRIGEIQADSDPSHWRHCPSEMNCADDASRGIKVTELSNRWCHGPDFLKNDEEAWPLNIVKPADNEDNERRKFKIACPVAVSDEVIESAKFSDWRRLQRVTAYVMRFVKLARKRQSNRGQLDAEELKEAEEYLIKVAQGNLVKKMDAGHFDQLTPFIDDAGIVRVGGRVDKASLPYDQRHPILLPRHNHISNLLMRESHQSAGHTGTEGVLANSRLRYWIVQGRTLAKSIGAKCVRCKWLRARPQQQRMADLPGIRLQPFTPPFYHTATDYFGPIMVKMGGRGRAREKRYGALFTCLTTRAVHIEVATDMSTPTFLQALRRFFARRGYPKLMLSDNGSNFVGAEKELKMMIDGWDKEELANFAAACQMKWQFNTPLAPHHGGVFEAMVKLAKKALKAAVGEQVLTHEELCTYLCEVENLVNSRPLGPLSADPNDGAYLTPNHLLLGRATSAVPQGPFRETKDPRKRLEFIQGLVNAFWMKWVKHCLPMLMGRKKWTKETRTMKTGDIVLLTDVNQPRGKWSMGRVVEVYPGSDGLVRSVKLKTATGDYVRPITKLCMLLPEESDESNVSTASMAGGMC